MSLYREDRELQIKLAELQADFQMYLTASFAFFAGLLAFLVGFQQIYFTLPSERYLTKNALSVLIPIVSVACFFVVRYFIVKMLDVRKQMAELRKRYVW